MKQELDLALAPEVAYDELARYEAVLAAAGLRNAEVAERLFISEGTVKLHLHNVYGKLKVGSRFDLTRLAREIGLV